MAQSIRASIRDTQRRRFDMRALWRLTMWGGAAALSLVVAVFSLYLYAGSQRITTASTGAASQSAGAMEIGSRSVVLENETRRLSEAVRALSADRERLLTRISVLEHNVEDITGAIKRQPPAAAAATPTASPPASAAPSPPRRVDAEPAVSPPASAAPPPPRRVDAEPAALPSAPAAPPPPRRVDAQPANPATPTQPTGSGTARAVDTKAVNAPPAVAEEEQPNAPKAEMGADVGGAINFNGLRLLWTSLKGSNSDLFEGLHPVVAVKEVPGRPAELRLVVGPIADADAASRFCVSLSVNRRYCQPTNFEGQLLQVTEATPSPVRKPAPPQEHRPAAPGPAAVARPPKLHPL